MDALGNYLNVLWRQSMGRLAASHARHGERDYAAYGRRLARQPQLEYSPVTRRWELRQPKDRLYLAARDGVALPRRIREAA